MFAGRTRAASDLTAEIPRLRRVARMLTGGDRAEADDLVQETLLRAMGAIDDLRDASTLSAWLTSILVNAHRTQKRREARMRGWLAEQPREAPAEPARQEQRLEVAETVAALRALPEEQRTAIVLVAVGDLSYADAARALGVKLGTLMSRISRGRAAMRARLEGADDTDGAQAGDERWTTRRRRT